MLIHSSATVSGIWSEARGIGSAWPPLWWRHVYSCPTCGYHFEAIDESGTLLGLSILSRAVSLHGHTPESS